MSVSGADLKVLFSPLTLGGVTLRNRLGMSPMCMYAAVEGVAQPWHIAHLGSRAAGGLGLIIVEATAVVPEGRISEGCLGLWTEAQAVALRPAIGLMEDQGVIPGIQLAHAGRKAGCALPWQGGRVLDGKPWRRLAPSALPFHADDPAPEEMTADDLARLPESFAAAARRAVKAGFRLIEIHAAHGYLLHSFLSPLTNRRSDAYGGDAAGRRRLLDEVVAAVRAEVPEDRACLAVRLSCSDWAAGGLTIEDSVAIAAALKAGGVDLVDCSSGGAVPDAQIEVGPRYQVPFAARIRKEAAIATAAVGMIATAAEAAETIEEQSADIVLLGRALLREPYWAHKAAARAGVDLVVPLSYTRGLDAGSVLLPV